MNLPPFYIGQRVVAIDNVGSKIKKNNIYEVNGLYQAPCCKRWYLDWGEKTPFPPTMAGCDCGTRLPPFGTGNYLCDASCFAPIEEKFESISLEKVLEQETKLISVN